MVQIENYWLLFIIGLVSAFVVFLYYSRILISVRTKLRISLSILRGISFFLLLFLLLSPIFILKNVIELKPKAVILVDNSKSIKNSKLTLNEIKEKVSNFKTNLENKGLDVEVLGFDKLVSDFDTFNMNGSQTDVFSSIHHVLESNSGQNLVELYIFSDGNYNLGNNPALIHNPSLVKVHSVLLGDTAQVADCRIESIESNPIMLSNETSIVNVNSSILGVSSAAVNIVLTDITTGKILGKTILNSSNSNINTQFKVSNLSKGKHHLRIVATSNFNEVNILNNQKDFFVDVVDGLKQIEILSNFPHPDLSFLKSVLSQNKSFEVNLKIADLHTSISPKSDLVILYQIPNQRQFSKELRNNISKSGTSVLYILGSQTNYSVFNQIQSSYKIELKGNIDQEYFPILNSNFSKFYLNESTNQFINKLTPLNSNLWTISSVGETANFFHSRIGSFSSTQPLISFAHSQNQMIGIIAGENLWKWKLTNYTSNKSYAEVEDIFEKIVNYLAIKKDKRQLVTSISSPMILESERLKINANTYNELYQPISPSKISCTITYPNRSKKSFDMISNESNFILEPQDLKSGDYSYQVDATINGKSFSDYGNFIVQKNDIETQYLPSNFEDMKLLTDKNDGNLVLWNNLESLLTEKIDFKNKITTESRKLKANDILWLLLLLLTLLSCEWILRKYHGLH